jgi:hypothetical protein
VFTTSLQKAYNKKRVTDLSLDKAIRYGKEKRKPYRGVKLIDATCRNHGSCPYCRRNRKHKFRDKQNDGNQVQGLSAF